MIVWDIVMGDNQGGPIDHGTTVATVQTPEYRVEGLPRPSRTLIGVHARDTETGLRDSNRNVFKEIIVNANGQNASERPGSPVGIGVDRQGSDGVRIRWRYMPMPNRPDPEYFHVFLWESVIEWDSQPGQIVTYYSQVSDYSHVFSGLISGFVYALGVRSVRGVANDGNTTTIPMTPKGIPPQNVIQVNSRLTFRDE